MQPETKRPTGETLAGRKDINVSANYTRSSPPAPAVNARGLVTRPTLSLKQQPKAVKVVKARPIAKRFQPEVPHDRFWFVWSPTERAPHYRHASLATAAAEAERLRAISESDKRFFIYEARCVDGDER